MGTTNNLFGKKKPLMDRISDEAKRIMDEMHGMAWQDAKSVDRHNKEMEKIMKEMHPEEYDDSKDEWKESKN